MPVKIRRCELCDWVSTLCQINSLRFSVSVGSRLKRTGKLVSFWRSTRFELLVLGSLGKHGEIKDLGFSYIIVSKFFILYLHTRNIILMNPNAFVSVLFCMFRFWPLYIFCKD